jgi:sigma-B regulation protein RsbU (phosphoserine phosphatase)
MNSPQSHKKESWKNLKRFYQLYKSDLSLSEIERLVKRDVPGLYDFYSRDMEKPDERQNKIFRFVSFIRNFFIAFLLKLTSARRLIYSLAIILFFYGLLNGMNSVTLLGFVILNIILALEVADKLMAKDELEVAREIQMSLMPKAAPSHLPFDIVCFSEPAREVGGDYYDFIDSNHQQNRTYLVIADVKGKGMAAALYMVRVQALLQYLLDKHHTPTDILIALNKNIRRIMRHDYFISMALSSIEPDASLHFSRAGHMPLIHFSSPQQTCFSIEPKGIAVGLENSKLFEKTIEEITLLPEKNDVLVFYTDGVVETMDRAKNQYGETALQKIIKEKAHLPAAQILSAILQDVARFRGLNPPIDDLTLIVMKKT